MVSKKSESLVLYIYIGREVVLLFLQIFYRIGVSM